MQIILQKNVPHVGLVGDLVNVKPGFFRNYLGPRSLAISADTQSIRQLEHHKKMIDAKKAKEKVSAFEIRKKIEATPQTVEHDAGQQDRLFGSITAPDIVKALRTLEVIVDRKQVLLEGPIKTLGEHIIEIKLHPEVVAKFKLTVNKKEKAGEAPKAA